MATLSEVIDELVPRAQLTFQHRAAEWNIIVQPHRFQSPVLVVILQARTSSGRVVRGTIRPGTVEPDAVVAMCEHAIRAVKDAL